MRPMNNKIANKKLINRLKSFRKDFFPKSDEEVFRAINELDLKYAGNNFYDLNINGALINLGTDKKSVPLISHAIKRLKSLYDNYPSNKFLFDIGNGFLSIADIKSGNKSEISLFISDKIYRQARKYFNQVSSRTDLPSAATNSGNILEKYARYYEAILLYEKALKFNQNFGMALGNKAISLIYYYRIAIKKNPEILFEAMELLKRALGADNTLEIGGQNAIDSFKPHLASLENYLSNKKRTSISNHQEPSPYQTFCSSKNIYLNFCFNCYKCKSGYKDNFFPPFIEKITHASDKERLKCHSFSKKMYYSVKTLDQILEDYATSRSIYFNASANKFNDLDEDTEYISVLDYCKNSIRYGYLKTAYLKLFNILDKIAHLTFYNYEPEQKDIYFNSLLSTSFKDFIIKTNNRGLLALHDLAWDFEAEGIYNHLKIIRYYLTHEFIDIKLDMLSDSNKQLELIENRNLTETLLMDYLDELFQIVKAALLYFGQALKKDYDEATENGAKRLLPLPIPKQKEIYEGIE
jgi:hypothetical protein